MSDYEGFYRTKLKNVKKGSGKNRSADCPFCGHKRDFSFRIDNGVGQCFREECGFKGDVFEFLETLEGIGFTDAKKELEKWEIRPLKKGERIEPKTEKKIEAPKEKVNIEGNDKKKISALYNYKDEKGELLFQIVRYEPKDFRPRNPDKKLGWVWGLEGVRRVLYRLPELMKSEDPVFITEGEKDVDSLIKLGLTATTSLGGAKWRKEYDEFLENREVILVPDNDETGWKVSEHIGISLLGKAKKIKWLELPDLKEKEDVSDWIARGGTKEELKKLAAQAKEFKPDMREISPQFEIYKIEKRRDFLMEEKVKPVRAGELLRKEFKETPYLIGRGLLPKQGYTMIAGNAKEGKTMLALSFALCLATGIPVFMREEDKTGLFPVPRKAKTLFLFRENTEKEIQKIIATQKTGLEKMLEREITNETLNSIEILHPKNIYMDMESGKRELERTLKDNPVDLVVIDPLSRFVVGDSNKMEKVVSIVNFIDDLGERYGCAFLLLHHFRKLGSGERVEEDPFNRVTGSAGWRNSYVSGIAMERKSKRRSKNIKKFSFEFRNEESPDPIIIKRDSDTLLFSPITEEEALEGSSSVEMLIKLMKKEFPNGIRCSAISDVASEKFGVSKTRIKELLKRGQEEGSVGKEKGKYGKYFVISQEKLSL